MGTRTRKRSPGPTAQPKGGQRNEREGLNPRLWAILLLVAATVTVYSNSLHNAFVFDDKDWIVQLPKELKLARGQAYRVIVRASYAVDYAISGLDPWGYHLTNIAYHALSAVFVFLIARILFDRTRPALLTALLFAIHPIQTESVTYLSGRRDVLSGLFVLMGFYAFLRYRRTGRAPYLALAIVAYLLGFFSKETAVILPLLCFSADVITHLRARAPGVDLPPLRGAWTAVRAALYQGRLLYVPLVVLAGGLAYYVLFIVRGVWMHHYHGGSFWFTMLTVARIFVHYIKLLIFPLTLIADYSYDGFPLTTSWSDARALAAVLILGAVAYGLLACLNARPMAAFGGAWFFLALLPASSIIPLYEPVTEHYLYVPSVGFFLMVVALADPLLDRPRLAPALYPIGLAILLMLSLRTIWRNADWKDNFTLWSKTVRDAPQVARARNNLGAEYLARDQFALAEEQFDAALKIKPNYATPYGNLGRIYLERNDLVRAEQALTRAIRGKRGQTLLHLWLGEVFLRSERLTEAEEQFRVALSDPRYEAYTYNKLGAVLANSGRLTEAEGAFKEAVRRRPNWAEPRENLARLYRAQRKNGPAGKPVKGALP